MVGRPTIARHNRAVSTGLILAALYRLLVWPSPQGNDCFVLANDEGQAADDLDLAKKLVSANPVLRRELEPRAKEIMRRDGAGRMQILPARDIAGAHGLDLLGSLGDVAMGRQAMKRGSPSSFRDAVSSALRR
jgi:hypothetical protein